MKAIPIALVLVVAFAAGCTGGDTAETPTVEPAPGTPVATATPPAAPTSTATAPDGTATPAPGDGVPSGGLALDQTCVNEAQGYAVDYPAGWHTNPGPEPPACRYFDPESFTVPEATEFFTAIIVNVDAVSFEDVRPTANENRGLEIVETRDTTIDGRDAVIVEARTTDESALLPPNTRLYQYMVDLDGRTLIASSYELADYDFEQIRHVLDRMMETMVIG